MKDAVLIPKDRIGIVNEKVRKKIKEQLGIEIGVVDNSVELEGEGIEMMTAKNIIKAIGRGFSPERAYKLLEEDAILEVIDLGRFNESRLRVIKSRVIGTKGKTRGMIESSSGAYVSVYGKTISIVGHFEEVRNAREAIDMLINGAMHKTVYRFLEQVRK